MNKKLIIQIPCYNEAKTLAIALEKLPKKIPGISKIEWLIINDGSQDNTVEIAKKNGVDHIVNFKKNKGLAKGFMAGIEACVKLGADIIVNTDADNQYNAKDIPKLIQPILDGKADIIVGERPIAKTKHFSPIKKLLQKIGSWVVRLASQTTVADAPSGFRAMNRDAAMQLNVYNKYTYTLETIIQAGQKNLIIKSVPIRTNTDLRPSRLVKSISSYVKKSIFTIFRIFVVYRPFRFFVTLGIIIVLTSLIISLRFLYYWIIGDGSGHIQSVILAGALFGIGFQTFLIAFIADLLAVNRRLLEDLQYRIKKIEHNHK